MSVGSKVVSVIDQNLQGRSFVQLPFCILRSTELSLGAKLFYAVILFHCRKQQRAYVGVETISRLLNCSATSVRKYRNELVDLRLIEVHSKLTSRTLITEILPIKDSLLKDANRSSILDDEDLLDI